MKLWIMKATKKDGSRTTTFRFKESTLDILSDASQATGLSMTAIIEKCVRGYLLTLLGKSKAERKEAMERLEQTFSAECDPFELIKGRPTPAQTAKKMAKAASAEIKKKRKK